MSEINVYEWEDIRKYFPPERIAKIRGEILELRKSGKYTDRELWEMYGMSSTSPTGSRNHLASFRFQNTFRLNV